MNEAEHTLSAIKAGNVLLYRAESLKRNGQIKDYRVVVSAIDPRIINSVVLIR